MKRVDPNIDLKCTEALDMLNESVGDEGFGAEDLERIVAQHPECEQKLREAYMLWLEMGQLEVPPVPEGAETRFLTMLDEFEEGQHTGAGSGKRIRLSTTLKWAAIFIIGVSVGVLVSNRSGSNIERTVVSVEDQFFRSLDTERSATEKLRTLQTVKSDSDPEEYVYEALYKTILNDPNINVRLSAVEAMLHFSDKPKVRTLLIKALASQDSPIVQLSLAEVIIKLQENESMDEIRKLLNSDQLHLEVRMHLKETLSQI